MGDSVKTGLLPLHSYDVAGGEGSMADKYKKTHFGTLKRSKRGGLLWVTEPWWVLLPMLLGSCHGGEAFECQLQPQRRLRGHRCLGVLLELVQPEEEVNDEYCHVLETRKKEHVTWTCTDWWGNAEERACRYFLQLTGRETKVREWRQLNGCGFPGTPHLGHVAFSSVAQKLLCQ